MRQARALVRHLIWDFVRDVQRDTAPTSTPPRLLLLAALVGAVLALFYQLGVPLSASHSARVTADEPFYLLTTVSLIEDGDLDLTNDYALRRYRAYFDHPQELWRQSVPTADGRLLSPHNLGTSLLILPAYAMGGLDGAKRALAVLGGATVTLAILLAYRATGYQYASVVAGLLLGASAPLFVYASQIYPEAPAGLLVTALAWLLLGERRGYGAAVLLALGLNGLVWLGTKYALVGATLALFGFARLRLGPRVALTALLGATGAFYAWFHLVTFGGLTPYAVNRLYAGHNTVELVGLHLDVWNRLYRFLGLWVDGEFGLVRWAPALLLTLPAVPLVASRSGAARWVLPCVFGTQLLVAVFLSITMRGWWFPGRMLVAVLPLLVVPLAHAVAQVPRRPWLGAVAVGLGLYTVGITIALHGAAATETVVLAVDPFAMPWPPFQALAPIFPVYTTYEAPTWILSALWLLVGVALVLIGRRWSTTTNERGVERVVRLFPGGAPGRW